MTRQAKYKKRPHRATRPVAKTKSRSTETGVQSELLALQRSAGNKVVSQLLQEDAGDQKHHVNVADPAVDSVLSSGGQPLESSIRGSMEALFNEDFSNVRIHTDAEAAESARAVNALAYTSGEDVVFGANQFDPSTNEGSQLIAHELAHTVQQRDTGVSSSPGSATTISRAPIPGAAEPESISLFSSKIPAPVVTRMGDVIVATVYFGQGSFLLDSRNFAAVDKLADELRYTLDPSVAVNGYASTEGKEENNQRLSENRRTAVIAILRSKLIGTATFSGKGHGAADPAVEESGKKGAELDSQRAVNRRVTIVIVPGVTSKPAEEEKKKPIKLFPDPIIDVKPETDEERLDRMLKDAIKEAEEKKRRGDDKQSEGKSFNDKFWEAFDKAVDDATKKLGVPEKLRPYVKDAARAAVEKGADAALDKALDQTPLSDTEKAALKAAIEAASKTKPK